eukprot:7836509-Alexandrium_andersonii.AAC.1
MFLAPHCAFRHPATVNDSHDVVVSHAVSLGTKRDTDFRPDAICHVDKAAFCWVLKHVKLALRFRAEFDCEQCAWSYAAAVQPSE